MEKELLKEFIEWACNCGKDVFYIFEETEQAIKEFLKFKQPEVQQKIIIEQMQLFEQLEVMLEDGQSISPDSLIRSQIQRTIGKFKNK